MSISYGRIGDCDGCDEFNDGCIVGNTNSSLLLVRVGLGDGTTLGVKLAPSVLILKFNATNQICHDHLEIHMDISDSRDDQKNKGPKEDSKKYF